MARSKTKSKKETAFSADGLVDEDKNELVDDEQDDGVVVEQEEELLQIDLGDMVKLKQVLDEAVIATVLQELPEDTSWDNVKLGLMAVACAFAMIAQFVPIPFPDSRPVLGVCGSLYFVLSGVLQCITTFIDQDSIVLTRSLANCATNPALTQYGVNVRTSLPRFSEFYQVTLQLRVDGKKKPKSSSLPPKVTQTWSIGKFFDADGYFDEVGLSEQIEALLDRLKNKNYDDGDKKKKQ